MTYNVFSGTLNPTQSINQSIISNVRYIHGQLNCVVVRSADLVCRSSGVVACHVDTTSFGQADGKLEAKQRRQGENEGQISFQTRKSSLEVALTTLLTLLPHDVAMLARYWES